MAFSVNLFAENTEHAAEAHEEANEKFDAGSFIFGHIGDSYEFHISEYNGHPISVPLPVIVYSSERGWFCFSSSRVAHGHEYEGWFIAEGGSYDGKIVELNAADTTQLKQLRGIGSGFAKMIVNYRTKLGGFYCKEQLLEVYHFPEETFRKIEHQLVVDTTLITPIFLNTADVNQLKRHPYIRYFQAKSLYDNRVSKKDKRYNTIKDIVLDRDVTSEFLRRIAPYLSFR